MIDPGRTSDGLVHLLDLFADLPLAGRTPATLPDRPLPRRGRPDVVPARAGDERAGLEPQVPALLADLNYSASRVGEYKYMVSSISDDDTDVLNPGGFTGVVQHYGYGRLYNLYLDPKETHSYMIRKLVYIDAFASGIRGHFQSLARLPGKTTVAQP